MSSSSRRLGVPRALDWAVQRIVGTGMSRVKQLIVNTAWSRVKQRSAHKYINAQCSQEGNNNGNSDGYSCDGSRWYSIVRGLRRALGWWNGGGNRQSVGGDQRSVGGNRR